MPRPLSYVAVDLETTGRFAYRDDIVELAAVRFDRGLPSARFSSLVRARIPVPADVVAVHGIDDQALAAAPSIEQVLPRFLELVDGLPVVFHNAPFDVGFLSRELAAHRLFVSLPVIDTLFLARKRLPHRSSLSLEVLCRGLRIPLQNAHRAEADALATGQLLWRLLGREQPKRQATFTKLLRREHRLEPLFLGTWTSNPRDLRLFDQCPPGSEVRLDYRSGAHRRPHRVRVEFFSRTKSATFLVGARPDGQRRTYRLDRIASWTRVDQPDGHQSARRVA